MARIARCREAVRRTLRSSRGEQRAAGDVAREGNVRDRRALACAGLAVLAIAGGLGLALAGHAARRAGTDGVWTRAVAIAGPGVTTCQAHELLPADATALRIPGATSRPPLVALTQRGRLLARGRARIDVRRQLIELPIPRSGGERADVELCITARAHLSLSVGPTPPGVAGIAIRGTVYGDSLPVDYLMAGRPSWWSYAPTVAARIGRGRGPLAAGRAGWLVLGLVAAALALAGVVVARSLVGSRPARRIAIAIALVAALNAAAWSLITPAFQVPDEVAHVAYVQALGETGRAPSDPRAIVVSPEELAAMADAGFGEPSAPTLHAAVWSPRRQRSLIADQARSHERRGRADVGEGEPEPPLYYALESIPYRAARHAGLLDRIAIMRLASAALAGLTALCCFLFVRECLPARPWAWAVGGLSVAFMPMLGFISGGVNPDALLYPLSAALFLCLARAWRRGVTLRLAALVATLLAAGMLTKVNFYGLVPGALLSLTLATRRTTLAWNRRLVGLLGATVVSAGALFALGTALQVGVLRRPFALGRPAAPESHVGLLDHLAYVWQVFLPRLPFQPPTTLTHPGYQQVFQSFVGVFGWMTVWLAPWAYRAAAVALAFTLLLAARMLHAEPRELRWRRGELLGYAAMALALMALIGVSADLRRNILHIVQGRYLLPLLPLLGALLALAARGAGERWGRAAGVAILAGLVALSLLGQLTTIAFFYS
jgi:predicted membrane protein DUF2142